MRHIIKRKFVVDVINLKIVLVAETLLKSSIRTEQNRTEGLFPYKHIIYK